MQPLTKNEGDMYIMSWMDIYNKLLGKKQRIIFIFFALYTLEFCHCLQFFIIEKITKEENNAFNGKTE